jgi:secreted Zn-dependent insulinase-like peptidase
LYRELCVLKFLALISQDWPHLEYVEEQMSTVESEFQDGKEHELSFAMNVGEIMFFRDLERSSLLSSISTISRFNPWAIPRFLRFLHPHNIRLVIVSQKVEDAHEREKWYGAEYRHEEIPASDMGEYLKPFGPLAQLPTYLRLAATISSSSTVSQPRHLRPCPGRKGRRRPSSSRTAASGSSTRKTTGLGRPRSMSGS